MTGRHIHRHFNKSLLCKQINGELRTRMMCSFAKVAELFFYFIQIGHGSFSGSYILILFSFIFRKKLVSAYFVCACVCVTFCVAGFYSCIFGRIYLVGVYDDIDSMSMYCTYIIIEWLKSKADVEPFGCLILCVLYTLVNTKCGW